MNKIVRLINTVQEKMHHNNLPQAIKAVEQYSFSIAKETKNQFTKKELKLLLEVACNEAQRYGDKKLTPPKEVYDIRYKIRDLLNSL